VTKRLLGVTEQCDATERPVIWIFVCFQLERENVGKIGSLRFLVDRAIIQIRRFRLLLVGCEDVYNWHQCVQHFGRGLDKTGISAIPTGTVQIQAIDVHT